MLAVQIIVNLIGFVLFVMFLRHVFKVQMTTHPEVFELSEGEEIVEIVKSDYWERIFLWQHSKNSGELALTNKRIYFKGIFLLSAGKEISVPYNEIVSVEKAFVAIFFPIAMKIKTVHGEEYKLAVMKRDKYINLINSLAQQASKELQTV